MKAKEAFDRLLRDYEFKSVLDVGAGAACPHAYAFHRAGKDVTVVDIAAPEVAPFRTLREDFMGTRFHARFDCLWASHVLEHALNPHAFLVKCRYALAPGGVFAVTVPPLKHQVVGGHVSLWNMGLLLYRLVLAGFDCSDAIGKQYGYNISVIVRNRDGEVPYYALAYDAGDIEKLAHLFPKGAGIEWKQGFNGDIKELNW